MPCAEGLAVVAARGPPPPWAGSPAFAAAVMLLGLLPSGCVVDVAVDDKACGAGHPCVAGFVCVELRCRSVSLFESCDAMTGCAPGTACVSGLCLPASGDAGAAVNDAGADPPDASPGPEDAGESPIDAGPELPNLVVNGGFETGSLSPWQGSDDAVKSGDAYAGTYSVELSPALGQSVIQYIADALSPGGEYRISAWVRVLEERTTEWGEPRLSTSKYTDLDDDLGSAIAENSIAAGWQYISYTRTFTAEDLSGNVWVGVRNFGFDGVSQVDEVRVYATDE